MIEVTQPLARFIVESKFDAIPEPVRRESVRSFVNSLGCMLGGSREAVVERALHTFERLSGPPEATVIGWGKRLDAPTAALMNTMSNFVHSYNDTHLATVAHPGGPPAAALLALAEGKKVNGAEFLHALILGVEVASRLANVIAAPPAKCHVGLSTHGVTNVVGTAVAAGKLMGLTQQQMVWAIGLAVTQAAGIRSSHGSMAGKLVGGYATRSGMISAYLAAQDFTCAEHPIEGPKGFAAVFSNPSNVPAAIDRLGEHYEMLAVAYKPYPSGIVNHAAIDAALKLSTEPGFDAQSAREIELRVHPLTLQLCDRPDPQNRMEALVSVQHWAAVSLLFAAAGLPQGTDRCVRDPIVMSFRRRIKVVADPSLDSVAATAIATMDDGRKLEAHVANCRGSHQRPMTDAELSDKFLSQATRVLSRATAEELLAACWRARELDDVGHLARRFLANAALAA